MLLPQIIGGLLKEKPIVPAYNPVSLTDEQRNATDANIANFGQISGLASDVNQFNQDDLLKHLRQVIPGYDDIVAKTRSVIDAQLSGEIPEDVARAIKRGTAGWAQSAGVGGASGLSLAKLGESLGITSISQIEKGLTSADRWIHTARENLMPNTFDVTKMFLSPMQLWSSKMENNTNQFNRDWMSNQLDAEYSLGTTVGNAMIKTDDQIMQIIASVAGSAGGSMLGGA